ncbi:MAG: HesA/MoeB/ThiF family protein [Archaeoglobus sp.]|nr:HesA/MoeB/ThiF family protein [Archaeoglobus sp.]
MTSLIDAERYSRQIMISYFGEEAQEKLLKAKVVVIGAGGLGSPAIMYLAAAGVGKLTVVDFDTVEKSNLQRQVIHSGRIGWNKAESAKEFVESLNPDVKVKVLKEKIEPENVVRIIENHDVVVSCPDNFRTRFILNDACRILDIPMVHAAIYEFEGEAMTIKHSPCYRCVYPAAPPSKVPGIIGATAGVLGSIQAVEAMKIITGIGNTISGLLRIDLQNMEFFNINVKPNESCPVCSGRIKRIHLENYSDSCKVVKFD